MNHPILSLSVLASAAVFVASSGDLRAQPNAIPGLDGSVSAVSSFSSQGRLGTYPNGTNGLSFLTTSCNPGSVLINFNAAMNPDHPFICFLFCRERNGRFEQISDRSYVKHAFASTNSGGCGTCTQPPGGSRQLGFGCSDTYGSSLNGNRYYLGPPAEVDPWTGFWEPRGSHFDRGEPDVGAPANNDGQRSLTSTQANAMDGARHRIEVKDSDLIGGGRFFYQGYYVFIGEPEANRNNNMRSQEVSATWGGSSWSFPTVGSQVVGSVLNRWSGATVTSNTNGTADGRFYVGLRVTGPTNGLYHYEYAIHNRDNSRGGASLRIPICSTARVLNESFRDIDANALNNWTTSRTSTELSFLAAANNALEWNTIYNFSFDSDAAPVAGQVVIDQARPGAGNLSVSVNADVPGFVPNVHLGPGCGSPAPDLHANGVATLGNAGFALRMTNVAPGASTAIDVALGATSLPLGPCTVYIDPNTTWVLGSYTADGSGVVTASVPVPNSASLQGRRLTFQGIEQQVGGALFNLADLSNGLTVRIGNGLSGCQ